MNDYIPSQRKQPKTMKGWNRDENTQSFGQD